MTTASTKEMASQKKWRKITRIYVVFLLLVASPLPFIARAQSERTALPPDSDPATALEDAIHPFDVIHRASQNWSDVERNAFTLARQRGKESCTAIKSAALNPDQLVAYARLCAFGDNWEAVKKATNEYLALPREQQHDDHGASSGQVSTAFDLKIQAELRLQQPDEALLDSRAMLQVVPYNIDAVEALDATITYLQFSDSENALALIRDRHPMLLAKISASGNPDSTDPSLNIPVSTLYSEALQLSTILQYLNRPKEADAELEKIEASLPASLPPHEAISIGNYRNRYLLLGKQPPTLATAEWLMSADGAGIAPRLDAIGETTALLIFPDWCIQCVALQPQLMRTWKRLRADDNRFFALLATDERSNASQHKDAEPKSKSLNKQSSSGSQLPPLPGGKPGIPHIDLNLSGDNRPITLLQGTPTFVVPSKTLQSFFTSEVPLVVILDRHGLVRVIQAAGDNYLDPGAALDQMLAGVNEKWPSQ